MWQTLAAQGIDGDRQQLGYPAHITLAIYPDDAPTKRLQTALAEAVLDWKKLPVTLSGFGVFPTPSAILWVAPVVTLRLLTWHAAIQAALPELEVDPYYHSDAWVPHVTLSGTLADPARALAALLPFWRPLTGIVERVELVCFRPVEILQSHALG